MLGDACKRLVRQQVPNSHYIVHRIMGITRHAAYLTKRNRLRWEVAPRVLITESQKIVLVLDEDENRLEL